jgi:hypothetical protein
MKNYEIYETPDGMSSVKATDENGTVFWIPIDPANSDYAEYLASLETPETLEAENN